MFQKWFLRLVRETIYPRLEDHVSVTKYPESVPGMVKTLFFLDHDHPEGGVMDTKSKLNDFEAHFAVELASYLSKQITFAEGTKRIVSIDDELFVQETSPL